VKIHGANDRAQEHQELGVGVRFLLRVQQIHAVSVAIDQLLCLPEPLIPRTAFRGGSPAVRSGRNALERFHDDHLVIAGQIGGFEERGEFELAGGDFVMAGLDRDAKAVQFPSRRRTCTPAQRRMAPK